MSQEEAKKPEFDLLQALPDNFVKAYNEGQFQTPEQATQALNTHYQTAFKGQGWKDKNDLIGTHNALQNRIAQLVKTYAPDADFSTVKSTDAAFEEAKKHIDALIEKASKSTKQGEGENEETTSTKKQLAQYQEQLKLAAQEREAAKAEAEQARQNAAQQLAQLEAEYETKSIFSRALEATKGLRIGVTDKVILSMFKDGYELQPVRDEQGKIKRGANGETLHQVVQKSTGEIVMDTKNGVPMPIEKVLPNLYKEMNILAQQPEQEAGKGNPQPPQVTPKDVPYSQGAALKVVDIFEQIRVKD